MAKHRDWIIKNLMDHVRTQGLVMAPNNPKPPALLQWERNANQRNDAIPKSGILPGVTPPTVIPPATPKSGALPGVTPSTVTPPAGTPEPKKPELAKGYFLFLNELIINSDNK